MGSLYRRGGVWWAKWYQDGRPMRESTKLASREGQGPPRGAKNFLKQREGRIAAGEPILPRVDRIRFDEVSADLKRHYAVTGQRGLVEAGKRFRHLDAFFAGVRVVGLGSADVERYVAHRQAQGAGNGTVNRELGVLGKMLRLAVEHRKAHRVPKIRALKEPPPRQGFFEREQFEAVRRHLPEPLQAVVTIAFTYGWRVPSEVLTLERRQLDLAAGTLRLDPGATKNDDGRMVYLTPELSAMLTAQIERVKVLERRLGRIIPWPFPHFEKNGHQGERRTKLRKVWQTACKRAGVAGRIPHDFRRTAVRNLERSGIPRSVAMKITGHRTEAVYRRYAIMSDGDLREASRRLAGTISGTVGVTGATLPGQGAGKSGR